MKTNAIRPTAVLGALLALFLLVGCGTGNYYDAYDPGVSYAPAGGWVDPNAQMVRADPNAGATTTTSPQQLLAQLRGQRAQCQAQIDLLGAELAGANRKRGAAILQEMDFLAAEIDHIDAEITTLTTASAGTRAGAGEITVQTPPPAEPATAIPSSAERNNQVVRADNRLVYSVQIGLLNHADLPYYNDLQGVKQVKRSDGYAYYYGSFGTKAQADAAARELRSRAKYRDAFTVALRGDQRVPLP